MSLYHVRISVKGQRNGEDKYNINEDELYERFIKPYKHGDPIIVNGRTISGDRVERFQVSKTDSKEEFEKKIQELRARDQASRVLRVNAPSYEWRAAEHVQDITDEVIDFVPGSISREHEHTGVPEDKHGGEVKNKAFIVHGHDEQLKNELEIFLHRSNIKPVVLHREADQGLTILEKFEQHSEVDFAFVLLTPDDVGMHANELQKSDHERKYNYRARQNVIFELVYFIGRLGRQKVCALYKSDVQLPSDINGLIYKKVEHSVEDIGYPILREMKQAGLNPSL
ncbi:TIR domain-containing protein [Halobacillus halophilus]|uniref:TIR domain-containing protein n=1 Tax=Halobacillus halophilus TaxID=1570 RepID=UPI001CD4260E|nr:nucleotide-binding protein [Halobacillus halophilus]MCA1011467.1 nucleotide-binding protein [Halobacillus halophilus]